MKKDLAFSLLVFCLTLIANFVMEHDHHFHKRKSVGVEKTVYKASRNDKGTKILRFSGAAVERYWTISNNIRAPRLAAIPDIYRLWPMASEASPINQKLQRSEILVAK